METELKSFSQIRNKLLKNKSGKQGPIIKSDWEAKKNYQKN